MRRSYVDGSMLGKKSQERICLIVQPSSFIPPENFKTCASAALNTVCLKRPTEVFIYEKGSQEDALPLAAFFCRL